MNLGNETPERQNLIIARIWAAIGIRQIPESDDAVDEMLAEWREALADLDLEAITARVEYWKGQGRSCPADEFSKETTKDLAKGQKPDKMSPAQVVEAAKKLYSESDETFEESYRKLGLHQRWGELPQSRIDQAERTNDQ